MQQNYLVRYVAQKDQVRYIKQKEANVHSMPETGVSRFLNQLNSSTTYFSRQWLYLATALLNSKYYCSCLSHQMRTTTMTYLVPFPCRRYGAYLYFQLFTHRDLFMGDDGDDEPVLSVTSAVGLLSGISVIVAFASE